MGFIYKITNITNGKIYIGKTEKTIEKRWNEHLREKDKERARDRPLYRAFNKYGVENFTIELIEEVTDEICQREIFWIEYFNSYSKGYNATKGGDGKSYIDKSEILRLFNLGKNNLEIANALNCSSSTVYKFLKRLGLSTRRIVSTNMKVSVRCIETDFVFESVSDASEFLVNSLNKSCKTFFYASHISACCRGKRKTVLGYTFEYIQQG